MPRRDRVGRNLMKGAIAGALATWVMDRVTSKLYERENPSVRQAEDRARGGKTAYEVAAEKLAQGFGRELDQSQRQRLGSAIHWALGVGAGAIYAAFIRGMPSFRRGGGGAFGTAFWAGIDEGMVSLLGLTPPPKAFPWQAHGRGLSGHLAYGIVAEQSLRVLDAVA